MDNSIRYRHMNSYPKQMLRFVPSPNSFHWWAAVALSWSMLAKVQGQLDYCDTARAFANQGLSYLADACLVDVSSCSASTTCTPGCDVNNDDVSVTTCTDGCLYTFNEFTVARAVTAAYGVGFLLFDTYSATVPILILSFTHIFTSGAEGSFYYSYPAVTLDSGDTAPEAGENCSAKFNGVSCDCVPYYCDSTQATQAHRIDCSAVPGGTVLDLCPGKGASDPASLMATLFYTPVAVCSGPVDDPSTTETSAPAAMSVSASSASSSFPPAMTPALDEYISSDSTNTSDEPADPAPSPDENGESGTAVAASPGSELDDSNGDNRNESSSAFSSSGVGPFVFVSFLALIIG